MPIVKLTPESLRRRKLRVNGKLMAATTEADIAHHAAEDNSSSEGTDFSRWRKVLPPPNPTR